MSERTEPLWNLPVRSQEFVDGPTIRLGRAHMLGLGYDYEIPSGKYAWESILFRRVQGVMFTTVESCTVDQVDAYDQLTEVIDSRWLEVLLTNRIGRLDGLRHFRIFLDDYGCIEVAATECQLPPSRAH